ISRLCVSSIRGGQAPAARLRTARPDSTLRRSLQIRESPHGTFQRSSAIGLAKLFWRRADDPISRELERRALMKLAKLNRCASIYVLAIALGSLYACALPSPELVSQSSVEDKISRLRIGQSDKSEVESIFGLDHGNDRTRWAYNFDDKQFEI